MAEHKAVIEARELSVYHPEGLLARRRRLIAGPVSFHIHAGEFVGLAGPSGSGKTSVGKAVLDLIPSWEGDVYWSGRNIRRMPLRTLRGRYSWIGQEPPLLFNPRYRILRAMEETMRVHGITDGGASRLAELCEKMQLDISLVRRYPFELSAGQLQRFALIRTLLVDPVFLVLDEPISSLDPINQMLIVRLLEEWRTTRGLAALFIAHSRRLLERICSRVINLEGNGG